MIIKKRDLNQERNKFISNGGSSAQEDTEWTRMNLRISTKMMKEIEAILNKEAGENRTSWVLRAIQEKLNAK